MCIWKSTCRIRAVHATSSKKGVSVAKKIFPEKKERGWAFWSLTVIPSKENEPQSPHSEISRKEKESDTTYVPVNFLDLPYGC